MAVDKLKKNSPGIDHIPADIFGYDEPLWLHSIECSLSLGHSAITRFRPWSPIAKELIWIAPK